MISINITDILHILDGNYNWLDFNPLFESPVATETSKVYVWFSEANGKIGARGEEGGEGVKGCACYKIYPELQGDLQRKVAKIKLSLSMLNI